MENNFKKIIISTSVKAPIEQVWSYFTEPNHIKNWYYASDDWHVPYAENDLRVGGKFVIRMEAKDGSFGFDYSGTYDEVNVNNQLSYILEDGRKVLITFTYNDNETKVIETFEAEHTNSHELQEKGWQAILNNFKRYVEK